MTACRIDHLTSNAASRTQTPDTKNIKERLEAIQSAASCPSAKTATFLKRLLATEPNERVRQAALVTLLPRLQCHDIERLSSRAPADWDATSRNALDHWLHRAGKECLQQSSFSPRPQKKKNTATGLSFVTESLTGFDIRSYTPMFVVVTDVGLVWYRFRIALDLGLGLVLPAQTEDRSWSEAAKYQPHPVRVGLRVGMTSIVRSSFEMSHSLALSYVPCADKNDCYNESYGWNLRLVELSWHVKKRMWVRLVPLDVTDASLGALVGLSWTFPL